MNKEKIKLNKKFYKDDCDCPSVQQFRIYDPSEKRFYFSGGTPLMLTSFFEFTAVLHTYYAMPYQRHTGLKDKNGKEIYEGDILLTEAWKSKIIIDDITDCKRLINSSDKVIGNIYENKELLK